MGQSSDTKERIGRKEFKGTGRSQVLEGLVSHRNFKLKMLLSALTLSVI